MIDSTWYERPADVPLRLAAGGVVARVDPGGAIHIALAQKAGESGFVLPKGGVKGRETDVEAALREIEEETGLSELELLADLGFRERLSFGRKRWVRCHYFLFRTSQVEATPTDRRFAPVCWFAIDRLPEMFWPEQRKLIEENRALIEGLMA